MRWANFQHQGDTYDLAHLHPCALEFTRAAKDNKPAVSFRVDVTFGLHCFSRRILSSDPHDKALEYSDARETRIFDFDRYKLSKRLPEIVRTLDRRKCRQTGYGNFFSVDIITADGKTIEYDIFFRVSKPGKKRIDLVVESAYVRDAAYGSNRPTGKPIAFLVILHNTLNNRPIRG